MIDWPNEFSFEEAARLVHPLVVLAVFFAVNAVAGYFILGSLRALDKEAKMSGEVTEGETTGAYFSYFLLSIIFMFVGGAQAAVCMGWWVSWGVTSKDSLAVLSLVSTIALGITPILGAHLPRRRRN